ncbi:glycosyltransferase [Alphaproteobacteria bacterium]|nr:glycosyltransferase [Alphaproteobacteria bacterium]
MNSVEKTKISIIMPVYNAEMTLLRAVRSVDRLLAFQRKVELIVVDDASTDNSKRLLESLASERPYMRVIGNTDNCGPGDSRYKGIKSSNSQLIGFLDADDELLVENYSRVLDQCVDGGHDLITFNALVDYGKGYENRYDFERLTTDLQKLKRLCLRGELDGCVMFAIFSKDLLEKANIRFGRFFFEDIEFNYKALLSAKNLCISSVSCYKKYNTVGSILNSCSTFHIDGLIGSALAVKEFLELNFELPEVELESDFRYCLADYVCFLLDAIDGLESVDERNRLKKMLKVKIIECGIKAVRPFEDTKKGQKANFFLSQELAVPL